MGRQTVLSLSLGIQQVSWNPSEGFGCSCGLRDWSKHHRCKWEVSLEQTFNKAFHAWVASLFNLQRGGKLLTQGHLVKWDSLYKELMLLMMVHEQRTSHLSSDWFCRAGIYLYFSELRILEAFLLIKEVVTWGKIFTQLLSCFECALSCYSFEHI